MFARNMLSYSLYIINNDPTYMIGKSLVVSTYTTNKLIQVIGEGGNVD